jgi:hypothetical protein
MLSPNPANALRASLFATWMLLLGGSAAAQQVVANHAADIRQLDLHTLRAIFGMRLTEWPNGKRITVYVMDPDSPLHNRFAKRQLQLFPYQLTQAWDRLVFSGTGQSPIKVGSSVEMRRRLLATPGSIGYLPHDVNLDGLIKVEVAE